MSDVGAEVKINVLLNYKVMSDYDYSTENEIYSEYPNEDSLYYHDDGQNSLTTNEINEVVSAFEENSPFIGMDDFDTGMKHSYWDGMNYEHSPDSSSLASSNADLYESHELSFTGKYSKAEIERLQREVDSAEYEVKCRDNDVRNWESKVSLNDTKEGHANGNYDHAVRRLNQAKAEYNDAVSRRNSAKSKLSNAL